MRATFGAILKSYRKKHNLTQTDLAHAVGIHPTYIGKLETSTTMRGPSVELVYRLAQVLEADAGELLEVPRRICWRSSVSTCRTAGAATGRT